MKIFSILFCLASTLFPLSGYSLNWSPTPPGPISGGLMTTFGNIFTSSNPNNGDCLATWVTPVYLLNANGSPEDAPPTNQPSYAIFNVISNTWTTPYRPIPGIGSLQTNGGVYSSYDTTLNKYLITWQNYSPRDPTHQIPYYAFTDGYSWTSPAIVPAAPPANSMVTSSSNNSGQFLVTWQDYSSVPSLQQPYYSTTDGFGWSPPKPIPGGSGSNSNVFSAYDPVLGVFLVTWAEGNNLVYATYNPTSVTWTPATTLAWGAINPGVDIFPSSNSAGKFLVTFGVATMGGNIPFYTIFDGTTWKSPTVIYYDVALSSTMSSNTSIYTSFNPTTGQCIATFAQDGFPNNFQPSYSVYNPVNDHWSLPAKIPLSLEANFNLFPTFNQNKGEFLVTWVDDSSLLPLYDTLSGPLVNKMATTTSVLTSPNPSGLFDKVTITAIVRPEISTPERPTGYVIFTVGGQIIGRVKLIDFGLAQMTACFNSFCYPTSIVQATYKGDANYLGSSGTTTHTLSNSIFKRKKTVRP